MPVTTNLTIGSPIPSDGGITRIITGVASGEINRQVTIEATPAPGFKFERFDVTSEAVELTGVNVGVYSANVFGGISNVCTSFSADQQTLYYDRNNNFKVFADPSGISDAPNGYYKAASGRYYEVADGFLGGPFTCPNTVDDGGGGGRGNE
jgi:hypothetical protein